MSLLDTLRDTFGYESVDSKRTANNKQVIDALTIEHDMNRFIREDAMETPKLNRLVHVMFKQIRQSNAERRVQLELFLDNWAFQHGGITKDNYKEALRAVVRYAASVKKRADANREAEDEAEGESADIDPDAVMKDFPL